MIIMNKILLLEKTYLKKFTTNKTLHEHEIL